MKRILDSDFRYRPSFDTDVRKTFEKLRRQQQARDRQAKEMQNEPAGEAQLKVVKLDPLKRIGSTKS